MLRVSLQVGGLRRNGGESRRQILSALQLSIVGTHLWGVARLRGFVPRGFSPNYSVLTQRQLPVKRLTCQSKHSFAHTYARMRDGEPGGVAWPVIVPNQPSSALGTVNLLLRGVKPPAL